MIEKYFSGQKLLNLGKRFIFIGNVDAGRGHAREVIEMIVTTNL